MSKDTKNGGAAPDANETAATTQTKPNESKTPGKIVTVTADKDLRVVCKENQAVFLLQANKPRELPPRLAMAAQVTGGEQEVVVTIK